MDEKDLLFNLSPIENTRFNVDIDENAIKAIVNAVARDVHQCVYVLDYKNNSILHAAGDLDFYFEGKSVHDLAEEGIGVYINLIPKDELEIMSKAIKEARVIIDAMAAENRIRCTLTMDFHLRKEKTVCMVNHLFTPISLGCEGRFELALCTMALSSKRNVGPMFLRVGDERYFFEFHAENGKWRRQTIDSWLLSESEKEVLRLSLQGLGERKIAEIMNKAVSTIKAYKKSIYDKLGADNITQAVVYALNYKLL